MRFPTIARGGLRRPIIPLIVEGPNGVRLLTDALVDTGADVTLLPDVLAPQFGIDLTALPYGALISASGHPLNCAFIDLVLELRAFPDIYRWRTRVGFAVQSTRRAVLGTRGFFECFRLRYDWSADTIEIEPVGPLPP
jgi:hypothetical protein